MPTRSTTPPTNTRPSAYCFIFARRRAAGAARGRRAAALAALWRTRSRSVPPTGRPRGPTPSITYSACPSTRLMSGDTGRARRAARVPEQLDQGEPVAVGGSRRTASTISRSAVAAPVAVRSVPPTNAAISRASGRAASGTAVNCSWWVTSCRQTHSGKSSGRRRASARWRRCSGATSSSRPAAGRRSRTGPSTREERNARSRRPARRCAERVARPSGVGRRAAPASSATAGVEQRGHAAGVGVDPARPVDDVALGRHRRPAPSPVSPSTCATATAAPRAVADDGGGLLARRRRARRSSAARAVRRRGPSRRAGASIAGRCGGQLGGVTRSTRTSPRGARSRPATPVPHRVSGSRSAQRGGHASRRGRALPESTPSGRRRRRAAARRRSSTTPARACTPSSVPVLARTVPRPSAAGVPAAVGERAVVPGDGQPGEQRPRAACAGSPSGGRRRDHRGEHRGAGIRSSPDRPLPSESVTPVMSMPASASACGDRRAALEGRGPAAAARRPGGPAPRRACCPTSTAPARPAGDRRRLDLRRAPAAPGAAPAERRRSRRPRRPSASARARPASMAGSRVRASEPGDPAAAVERRRHDGAA